MPTSFLKVFSLVFTAYFALLTPLHAAGNRPTTRAEIIPPPTKLKLATPGVSGPIPYEKFGHFDGVGTKEYRYVIDDKNGLAEAAGEGIFPNNKVFQDPRYKSLMQDKKLEGNHWKYADEKDAELAFYKWASINEEPGVKQFFVATMLERAGLIEESIKAFYAVAIHFPKSVSYTYYKTPWYVGPAALDRVEQLLRRHPKIKMELKGARIEIANRFDNDTKNDVFKINPGQLVAVDERSPDVADLSNYKVVQTVGGPTVQLKKYDNGHWQLTVDGKPFPVKAITYSPTPVGASPDRGTWNPSKDWQLLDTNKNGLHDGFFEAYVDANGNGKRDGGEKVVGDAKLLKDMGVNTLRFYHHAYDKELMRKLHKEYGFYILCGDLLGGYAVGSGAPWDPGTDYTNAQQRKNMLESVTKMVEDLKDEPYVLMWVLGNENIYGVANNSQKEPEAFYSFVNEAARLIKKLDPTRPVVHANGDLYQMGLFAAKCPDVDVMGANAYRGEQGFGSHLFMDVKAVTDKPVLITEYGASAYAEGYTLAEAEAYQAMYLANNWDDLEANMAGRGVGNALGGVLFEYLDEWWKANSDLPEDVQKSRAEWYEKRSATYKSLQPENHDEVPQFGFPFLDGWSYEEWYGVAGQGNGKNSPFLRVLRPAYHTMKSMWTRKN